MDFGVLFKTLKIPVIVCCAQTQKVSYINPYAVSLLKTDVTDNTILSDVLKPAPSQTLDLLIQNLKDNAYVKDFVLNTAVLDSVKITANVIDEKYHCFYIKAKDGEDAAIAAVERVIDNIEAMVYVIDPKTNRIIYMNSAMARERGIKDKAHEEIYCYQMFMRDVAEPCESCPNKQLFDEDGNPTGEILRSELQSSINNKWYSMSAAAVEWINGEYVYLKSATEITERKNNEDILKKSASTDAMTNVYNREWGYKALDKLISDVMDSDAAASVVFIDVDGLKFVNDNYGHIEGDKIIIGVVDALKKCTRKNDVIFRWGGDEFVVLLPGCTQTNAEAIMINSIAYLDEINKISTKPYVYAFSYGIFEINSHQENYSSESIIKIADSLMYAQKNKKKIT